MLNTILFSGDQTVVADGLSFLVLGEYEKVIQTGKTAIQIHCHLAHGSLENLHAFFHSLEHHGGKYNLKIPKDVEIVILDMFSSALGFYCYSLEEQLLNR